MIVTNREHALDYLGLNERLDKALRFIADTDIAALADGNHLIDGEDVRVKVQHMQTKRWRWRSSKLITTSQISRCCLTARSALAGA